MEAINKEEVLIETKKNIEVVLEDTNKELLENIEQDLYKLQRKIVELASEDKDYTDISKKIEKLRNKKQELLSKSVDKKIIDKRLSNIQGYLAEIGRQTIEEYDDKFVKKLIEKIEINKEVIEIEFKDGEIIRI